jgi:hypothetical protein
MSSELLNSLVNLSDLRPKPPHPIACIGAYIGPIDAKNYCWEIKSALRDQCQTQIYVEIQKYLEDHFGSVPNEDRITISFYMIGKSPQAASPTILFISENSEYRKDARKAIKTSGILSHYPGFKTAHSAKDPGFQKMEQLASNSDSVAGLSMRNSSNHSRTEFQTGASENWGRQLPGESIHARLARVGHLELAGDRPLALERTEPPMTAIVPNNNEPSAGQAMEVWFDRTQPVKTFGMPLYVRHLSSTRIATANAIQLKDRVFFQMALHPFLARLPPTPGAADGDDEFEIDSDTDVNDNQDDHDVAMTSTGSRTPGSGTQSPELGSGSSRRSSDVRRITDDSSGNSSGSSEPVQDASDKLVAFALTPPVYEPQELVLPSSASLSVLGRLVAASISTDWALIEIEDPELEATLKADKSGYMLTADKFARSPKDNVEVRTSTASHGPLSGILSAWPSYTRLPYSKTVQRVYVVRFDGPLADGDCGSVVIGVKNEHAFGHLVAGCRKTGSAYVLASSEVKKDILKFSSTYKTRAASNPALATASSARQHDQPLRNHPVGFDTSGSANSESAITPATESWVNQVASESIHARLARAGVHFDLVEPTEGLENSPSNPPRAECPRSIHTNSSRASSMAPALVHQSAKSAYPPSLVSYYTEATPTETSISTGLANHLSGALLLEENDGVLELPRSQVPVPVYECAFWFLSCGYISRNQEEWITHCESHFRGEEPPHSVQCPLCDWSASSDDGRTSWNARMLHLATEHTMLGQTLRTSRPDFGLFHHLWKRRLIDDQDYKELQGGNHNLRQQPGNFVETNGRERRRNRDERRHRRQHVTTPRAIELRFP